MDTDLQLLDRYARTHDADAFTQLVRRHAGMVFAAARRITSDHHDAEEVAQSCLEAALSGGRLGNIELAHRPGAPSIVGIHITVKHEVPGGAESVMGWEATYWLDTSRNYVPVEMDAQAYDKEGNKAYTYMHRYLEYARLSDGRWYPYHWQRLDQWGCLDYRFTFLPGKTLDARWFEDPAVHFAGDVVGEGISPAKEVTRASHAVTAAVASAASSAWLWWPWALAVAVFGTAAVLLIRQRRNPSSVAPLRGASGPRRK